MFIPTGIFLALALLSVLSPLAAFVLGSWVYYAGRTGKNPAPTITFPRRQVVEQKDPAAPNGKHTIRS